MTNIAKSKNTATTPSKSRYHVEALAKGLRVLSLFSPDRQALKLAEISALTGLNNSSALRFVATLTDLGYLECIDGKSLYRPAIEAMKLGYTAIASLDFCALAKPSMHRIHEQTGEMVILGVFAGDEIVTIERVRNAKPWPVQNFFGHRVPIHCTAPGKLMLAYLPESTIERLKSQLTLEPYGPNTIVSWDELLVEIDLIRERGFALANEELSDGICSVSAPILGADGNIVACLSVPVPKERFPVEAVETELAPLVVSTAGEISEQLKFVCVHVPEARNAYSLSSGERQVVS